MTALGVFSVAGGSPRVGARLGSAVVDLGDALGGVFTAPSLNQFLALGRDAWRDLHERDLSGMREHELADVTMHLPIEVGDYADFYSSIHHAGNMGRLLRPDDPDPLTPNWRHMPIGYHGRAGTVVVSGTTIRRPSGQRAKGDFGPSRRLDVEVEVGFVVGVGSRMGEPVGVESFRDHVFGVVLLNDWSARDIQSWEYQPLGPFLGKSFATSISAWVTPLDALEHAEVDPPEQDPQPLPYLRGPSRGYALDLVLERNGEVVSRPPFADMYWTAAQQLAHLTVNGASTRTGDLFGSGTVSGPADDQRGSFAEIGEGFLADGDEIVISGTAGHVVLGEVRGRINENTGMDLVTRPT